MNNLMKNKLALAGIGAVILVALIAGFVFMQNKKAASVETEEETVEEQAVMMTPEEIGLTLEANAANTEITMTITDVTKFDSFEYEMNYDAEVDGEIVPRGAIGSGEVEPGETSITRDVTVGTCSAGKCKYDKGVEKVSFIIKLNLKDGTSAIVKDELVLTE